MTSPAGLGAEGYGDCASWLLREKLPQFPALPARTWPFARPLVSPGGRAYEECPETGGDGLTLSSTSDPLKEWRTLDVEEALGLWTRYSHG